MTPEIAGGDAWRLANVIALEEAWEATVRRHTCLLCWNTGVSPLVNMENNGSCCLLQTAKRRLLATCAHVWQDYKNFQDAGNDAKIWISHARYDAYEARVYALQLANPQLLSIDESLDLATVVFDQINWFEPWRFWRFQPRNAPPVRKNDPINLLGFPGDLVKQGNVNHRLNSCLIRRVVHDVGSTCFVLHSEPGTVRSEDRAGNEIPAVRITGVSGAPVFRIVPGFKLGLAGIVTKLSSSGLTGNAGQLYELGDGDVYAAHACLIQEDGTVAYRSA